MVKLKTTMPTKYNPLNDSQYMSKAMKAFFRAKLKSQRGYIHKRSLAFGKTLQGTTIKEADFVDQSSLNQLRYEHLAYNKREQHRHEIELALQRLFNGNYGYCLATGEPIGVQRLLAEPCAKYCLEAQISRENLKFFNR